MKNAFERMLAVAGAEQHGGVVAAGVGAEHEVGAGRAGHALGHDGRWVLVGNPQPDDRTEARFWVSTNLVHWSHLGDFKADMSAFPGFQERNRWHGAPNMNRLKYDQKHLTSLQFCN